MQAKTKKCFAINEISKQPTFVHFFEMGETFCQIFDSVFRAKDKKSKLVRYISAKNKTKLFRVNLIYDVITENGDNKFWQKR